ncbi:hypothetical protein G6F52_013938 [Rhizopus delemar]|nr:hypothetical protein G6F52_013938 [Rhizopus delemar]
MARAKVAACSWVRSLSSSSARARWVISTMRSTCGSADRRACAARKLSTSRPRRCMPLSSFSHPVSGRGLSTAANASSGHDAPTANQKAGAATNAMALGAKIPSSSRIGARMPAWRSSSASSMVATPKPSASPSSACAQRTAPWP